MPEVLYDEFLTIAKGEKRTFFYQEYNPTDRDTPAILELQWTHDHVDGDLVYGKLDIAGIGSLDIDAYGYRISDVGSGDGDSTVWLSSVNLKRALNEQDKGRLTGGPLSNEPLLPSEIVTRTDPRRKLRASKPSQTIPFSSHEYEVIQAWQLSLQEKGFKCCFSNDTYARYKTWLSGSLYDSIELGGLNGGLEIQKVRKGVFLSMYSVYLSDDSFRRTQCNTEIKHAYPGSTRCLHEECKTFSQLIDLMDQSVDLLVERNRKHLACAI